MWGILSFGPDIRIANRTRDIWAGARNLTRANRQYY
jgi:hypothetical protein